MTLANAHSRLVYAAEGFAHFLAKKKANEAESEKYSVTLPETPRKQSGHKKNSSQSSDNFEHC